MNGEKINFGFWSMVSERDIEVIISNILNDYQYSLKCGRNKIPSTRNNYVRFSEKTRKTMEDFINKNCGDNYNSNEKLWVITDEGDLFIEEDGDEDSVMLSGENDDLIHNAESEGLRFHTIHNHHHNQSFYKYASKMPECLSPEDIMQCVTNDWSKSTTAVNGVNKSRMTLMKSSDFLSDFEIDRLVEIEAGKLKTAYFNYIERW